ncbi:hypothetical protein FPFC_020430 [Fructobacillus pseudoficulneus]|uniref:Major facilitator superfamily (MFS) profile domain-containing protein n=1 Tax=Fructobacillus pseudoficulneus TaxID=220714 RepID=A0A3F3GSQ8_9LACO|nr:MFS transporter [Fructobacillus pseudoficulneus]GAP02596.1 hypothetical protein FPFC_020430 [Fructobacillus pseudoficulneus]SEH38456.1 Predicted arabinose efflux permease, MFS family [Fructobacillus pseudoficulneus]
MAKYAEAWDSKTTWHRFWILAVSLSIATGKGIAPILPSLQKTFGHYPVTLINMVATVQQIPALIVLLFSSRLANRFGIKKVIGTGLAIMGVAGILPAVINDFWLIFASRLLFGVGIGLTNSLAITLIDFFYEGNDQAQMLGNRTAFEPIGLCIVNLTVGWLLTFSWHYSFLAYGLMFLILWGFWQVVPEYPHRNQPTPHQIQHPRQWHRLSWPIIEFALYCGILTVGMSVVNVYTPYLVLSHRMGSAMVASVVITAYTIFSMLMGFLFGVIFKYIHRYVFILGLFMMALGALLMNSASQLYLLVIAVILIGFSYPLAGTYLFNTIANRVPKRSAGIANSILLVGCNAGTALAPALISLFNTLTPGPATDGGIGLYGLLMLGLTVVSLPIVLRKRN